MTTEKIEPDEVLLMRLIPQFRLLSGHTGSLDISRRNQLSERIAVELDLKSIKIQERYIDTLERSITSQDRLANTQNNLTIVGVAIALFQLISMFILPNL